MENVGPQKSKQTFVKFQGQLVEAEETYINSFLENDSPLGNYARLKLDEA